VEKLKERLEDVSQPKSAPAVVHLKKALSSFVVLPLLAESFLRQFAPKAKVVAGFESDFLAELLRKRPPRESDSPPLSLAISPARAKMNLRPEFVPVFIDEVRRKYFESVTFDSILLEPAVRGSLLFECTFRYDLCALENRPIDSIVER